MTRSGEAAPAVHTYDEWSKLEEVIVGVADHYDQHHVDDVTFKVFHFNNIEPILRQGRVQSRYLDIPPTVVEELQEDIEGFVEALEAFGATVLRPVRLEGTVDIETPFWSSRATPALNVRDQTIVLGETIVETAPHVRARYFENDYLKPIFYEYLRRGSRWIAMPKPVLSRDSLDFSYHGPKVTKVNDLLTDADSRRLEGLGYEMVFDGAQCIRLGRDVLVNVANENHRLGYEWLVANFGDRLRFHELHRMADSHIDSMIMPLRPGCLLLRSPHYRDYLPEALRRWDVIYAPEVTDDRFPDYGDRGFNLASRFIDINVLSLDENTVVVNALYPELIDVLTRRGFEVVPVRHRHRRLFSGGFHCFTLDCVRQGGPESYLD
jgi:glycine amidinotransferase